MGVDSILQRARSRAEQAQLPYAGALTPAEAHAVLQADPRARLVDVRTAPELEYVGQIPGSLRAQWNQWPSGRNPNFLDELQSLVPRGDTPLLFLCRSGGRSNAAAHAATQAGWTQCFNILEGFEGDKDTAGHRNTVGGWRKAGLPWTQG